MKGKTMNNVLKGLKFYHRTAKSILAGVRKLTASELEAACKEEVPLFPLRKRTKREREYAKVWKVQPKATPVPEEVRRLHLLRSRLEDARGSSASACIYALSPTAANRALSDALALYRAKQNVQMMLERAIHAHEGRTSPQVQIVGGWLVAHSDRPPAPEPRFSAHLI